MTLIADAKNVLDPVLTRYGLRLAVEHYDHESFGSTYLEYVRRNLRFRLVWDGRDGILTALVADVVGHAVAHEWLDLEFAVEGRQSSLLEAQRRGRAEQLRDLAEKYLSSQRTSK